ncbi:MAG: alpha/beta hydrolase [Bacteroidota bacterium]
MVNQVESERMTLEMLKELAKKRKDKKAIEELSVVSIPYKSGQDLYYARKWLFDFEGKSFAKKKSFKNGVLSWSLTWLELFNESSLQNLFESTKKLDCPVFFIVGQKDYQTNYTMTQKYYDILQAPQKDIYTIEEAGHLIPYEQGKAFQDAIIENTLPIIEKSKN